VRACVVGGGSAEGGGDSVARRQQRAVHSRMPPAFAQPRIPPALFPSLTPQCACSLTPPPITRPAAPCAQWVDSPDGLTLSSSFIIGTKEPPFPGADAATHGFVNVQARTVSARPAGEYVGPCHPQTCAGWQSIPKTTSGRAGVRGGLLPPHLPSAPQAFDASAPAGARHLPLPAGSPRSLPSPACVLPTEMLAGAPLAHRPLLPRSNLVAPSR
jgi:hypothetical protein